MPDIDRDIFEELISVKFLKTTLLTFLFMTIRLTGFSQSSESDNSTLLQEIKSQLQVILTEPGEFLAYCSKNNIKGQFEMDITVAGKGEVVTVFLASSSTDDISSRNLLKDKIATLKFKNVKIPNKERIKFRQTITL